MTTTSERERALEDVLGYHYWRECPDCGYAGGGYLHCLHDGVQSNCHRCGKRLPTISGDCQCAFVAVVDDVRAALALPTTTPASAGTPAPPAPRVSPERLAAHIERHAREPWKTAGIDQDIALDLLDGRAAIEALQRERDVFVRLFDPEGMNVVWAVLKAQAAHNAERQKRASKDEA